MAAFNFVTKLAFAKAGELLASPRGQHVAKMVAPLVLARLLGRSVLGRLALRAGLGGFVLPLLAPIAVSYLTKAVSRRALATRR